MSVDQVTSTHKSLELAALIKSFLYHSFTGKSFRNRTKAFGLQSRGTSTCSFLRVTFKKYFTYNIIYIYSLSLERTWKRYFIYKQRWLPFGTLLVPVLYPFLAPLIYDQYLWPAVTDKYYSKKHLIYKSFTTVLIIQYVSSKKNRNFIPCW